MVLNTQMFPNICLLGWCYAFNQKPWQPLCEQNDQFVSGINKTQSLMKKMWSRKKDPMLVHLQCPHLHLSRIIKITPRWWEGNGIQIIEWFGIKQNWKPQEHIFAVSLCTSLVQKPFPSLYQEYRFYWNEDILRFSPSTPGSLLHKQSKKKHFQTLVLICGQL